MVTSSIGIEDFSVFYIFIKIFFFGTSIFARHCIIFRKILLRKYIFANPANPVSKEYGFSVIVYITPHYISRLIHRGGTNLSRRYIYIHFEFWEHIARKGNRISYEILKACMTTKFYNEIAERKLPAARRIYIT